MGTFGLGDGVLFIKNLMKTVIRLGSVLTGIVCAFASTAPGQWVCRYSHQLASAEALTANLLAIRPYRNQGP